jgi:DNA polymerase IIIc chi subunit
MAEVLNFVVHLTEKIFDAQQKVAILCEDQACLKKLDQLLWSEASNRFLAHEIINSDLSNKTKTEILLVPKLEILKSINTKVLINLSEHLIQLHPAPLRIIEILWENEHVKTKARKRYSLYQTQKAQLDYLQLTASELHNNENRNGKSIPSTTE